MCQDEFGDKNEKDGDSKLTETLCLSCSCCVRLFTKEF